MHLKCRKCWKLVADCYRDPALNKQTNIPVQTSSRMSRTNVNISQCLQLERVWRHSILFLIQFHGQIDLRQNYFSSFLLAFISPFLFFMSQQETFGINSHLGKCSWGYRKKIAVLLTLFAQIDE